MNRKQKTTRIVTPLAFLLASVLAAGVLVAGGADASLDLGSSGRTETPERHDPVNADVSADRLPGWVELLEERQNELRYGRALWSGGELVVLEDNISDGRAVDMSARANAEGRTVVENDTVAASHDLGNGYVLARWSAAGQLILHAGVELLDPAYGEDASYVEFEFNQGPVQAIGTSTALRGERKAGDLLVRLSVQAGGIGSVELQSWDGQTFRTIESGLGLASGGCSAEATHLSYCDRNLEGRLLKPNGELYDRSGDPVVVPTPNRFVEIGLNAGVLVGADAAFSTVQLRTPEDILLGSFSSMGEWAERRSIDDSALSGDGIVSIDDSAVRTLNSTEEN